MFQYFGKPQGILILVFFLTGCEANGANFTVFKFLKGPSETQGLIPTDGVLDESFVKNKIDCAKKCTENRNCASMYYLEDTQACKIHAQRISALADDLLVPSNAAVYYELDKNDPATTTPTTTIVTTTPTSSTSTPTSTSVMNLTESAPCPPDDSSFRHAQTSAGIQFQFRVLMGSSVNFAEAEELCTNLGAKPYTILNADKLAFTQKLMTCAAYSSYDFWINGMYNEAIGTYFTLEGEPIPQPSALWAQGRPNGWAAEPCVWLANMHTYYLDDRNCNTLSDHPAFTICEI